MRRSISIPQQDPDGLDDAGVATSPLGGSPDGHREQVERLVADVLPCVGEA